MVRITKETFHEYYRKGLQWRLTDRGNHYCETLRAQYLQGLPIKDERLMVLSTLMIHYWNFTVDNWTEGNHLVEEIRDRIGGDYDSWDVIPHLVKAGFMERNPEFDQETGEMVGKALVNVLEKMKSTDEDLDPAEEILK